MKRFFVYLLVLIVCSLNSLSSVYAEDKECKEDPHACFEGTDENGKIIPKDPTASRTFSFPATKVGFVIDFRNFDIVPHLSLELFDFSLPWVGDFAIDSGVGTSRAFISLTWEFLPVIKAGPSIWGGYNVKDNDYAYGVGVSILDF